jgi:hypothetical protein
VAHAALAQDVALVVHEHEVASSSEVRLEGGSEFFEGE